LNFDVVGFLDEKGEGIPRPMVNPGVIAAVADISRVTREQHVNRIVLSFAERRGQMPVSTLMRLKLGGVHIEDAHSMYEKLTGRIMLEMLNPSSIVLSEEFHKSRLMLNAKRLLDILVSAAALVVLSPLLILVAAAIYLESGRPILYRQRRVGLRGGTFDILKFRSMRQNAEESGPVWASKEDNRVTRVGRWLRKYRIDEFPQFVNVLRGDMSIVGPRPERPEFVSMLEEQVPYYSERHSIRPGITGWAQIKYQYGSSVEEAKTKLEFDLFYSKHVSILFDLVIALRTIQVLLFGKGAV
jgi:sugar transferase (PEP-CTERM system associated)